MSKVTDKISGAAAGTLFTTAFQTYVTSGDWRIAAGTAFAGLLALFFPRKKNNVEPNS